MVNRAARGTGVATTVNARTAKYSQDLVSVKYANFADDFTVNNKISIHAETTHALSLFDVERTGWERSTLKIELKRLRRNPRLHQTSLKLS